MIKLKRPKVPACLDSMTVARLTAQFKKTGDSVWNIPALKTELFAMSNGKCCYCESPLGTRSAYLEVEHFKSKNQYPDDVLAWNNLLPSCRRCNGKKHTHDVMAEPMVNPARMTPKCHIKISAGFRYKHVSVAGNNTLTVLEFNTDAPFMMQRYKMCLALQNQLEELRRDTEGPVDDKICRRIVRKTKAILAQALPSEEFSATLATILTENEDFSAIKAFLQKRHIWDADLENAFLTVFKIALI